MAWDLSNKVESCNLFVGQEQLHTKCGMDEHIVMVKQATNMAKNIYRVNQLMQIDGILTDDSGGT